MTSRTSDTPPHDSTVHARDIEVLAREAHVPLDDVAQLYARELAALTAGARITSFLPILTTRKVRAILRQRCHPIAFQRQSRPLRLPRPLYQQTNTA